MTTRDTREEAVNVGVRASRVDCTQLGHSGQIQNDFVNDRIYGPIATPGRSSINLKRRLRASGWSASGGG